MWTIVRKTMQQGKRKSDRAGLAHSENAAFSL
jgi:hypothetical protein